MKSGSVKVRIATPAGPVAVVGSETGVEEIYFEGPGAARNRPPTAGPGGGDRTPVRIPDPVRSAVEQLQQYFAGRRVRFDFPVQQGGTDFQRRVWSYVATIPYGETRTYGQVAAAVGRPGAARAVGGAVGRNPLSVVVPCHRVVAADAKGGGYGGGMAAKLFLLRLEAAAPPASEDRKGLTE